MYSANASTEDPESKVEDRRCKAVDRSTGELCGETESLSILHEFQKLYEDRIQRIDRELENECDRASMKLQIMGEWIKNLEEQNVMLVRTVQDLEYAACSRVKLLEEKLKQSSTIVSENMSRSNYTQQEINALSIRVNELEKDEEHMQQKIDFLKNDIAGLLELIRRAKRENDWNLDGITFMEIQPSDIPTSIDCTCEEGGRNIEQVESLQMQIKQLQENGRKMMLYQEELEKNIQHLTRELFAKDETIKEYTSQFQSITNSVKRHAYLTDEAVCSSAITNSKEQNLSIVLLADIVESVLIEKNLETKTLREQLQNTEAKMLFIKDDRDLSLNDLKTELQKKSKEIKEFQQQMTNLQNESLETQEVLTAEIVEKQNEITSLLKLVESLQEQCGCMNMQIQFKEDIIKELRKELKQASIQDSGIPKCADNQQVNNADNIMSYLTKTKHMMEEEKEALFGLKTELEKVLEKLQPERKEANNHELINVHEKLKDIGNILKEYKTQILDHPESAERAEKFIASIQIQVNNLLCAFKNKCYRSNQLFPGNTIHILSDIIQAMLEMVASKEKSVAGIECMMKSLKDSCNTTEIRMNLDERSKLMEAFKVFSAETQVATEYMREEIETVISAFNSQCQNCTSLDEIITNMQDVLVKTQEELAETINTLELQEENRVRHNNRMARGEVKLKDIKNEINLAQSRLSCCASDTTIDAQDIKVPDYADICTCNDLLNSVMEETEQVFNNVQIFQTQLHHLTSNLCMLKSRLCKTDSYLKDVRKKTHKTLLEQEKLTITLREKEKRMEKFEREISNVRIKMENILDSLSSMDERCDGDNTPLSNQALTEVLRIKRDLYNLQNENDDLKRKACSEISHAECNGKTCQWKCKIPDLQEQIKLLEHERKIQQEANYYLRNTIKSMEEELQSAQEKMENLKRTHSSDSMELKKKIMELENVLKMQKETEYNLRQHLDENEVELKKSKELLNALHSDCGVEGMLVRCGCNQLKQETMSIFQLFKWLQNTIQSTKSGIQDLENDLKKMICESSPHSCSSARWAMIMIEKLSKYKEDLDKSSQEIDKLKEMLYSKEKLIENMEEIIKIQKDSIAMTQAELKELHQKLQEKINAQDQIINQYKKEKSELLKQNELQIQTIGHLQNAVVEAKRCLDQMGHKAVSDLQKRAEIIRELTICIDETQSQYNDCFTEAAEQDQLLDLQRDSIKGLQEKMRSMEQNHCLTMSLLQNIYHSVLSSLQGQLEARVNDFQTLRSKINALVQSKNYFEGKYLCAKKSWEEAEQKLQELKGTLHEKEPKSYKNKMCQIKVEIEDKNCDTQDIVENVKNENVKCCSRDTTRDVEELLRRLELNAEDNIHCNEKTSLKLEDKQSETICACDHGVWNDVSINKYVEATEKMQKKLHISERENKAKTVELDTAKDVLSILRDRVESLKVLLTEKSDRMAKLEADYAVLKNDNTILKAENNMLEARIKDDVSQLKQKLKDAQMQHNTMENNYRRVSEDFRKTQEQLIRTAQRETDLQETLTITEKEYSLKLINAENEITRLGDLVDKLSNEMEKIQINNMTKSTELCKYQEACKSYMETIEDLRQHVESERERGIKLEESNRCLVQQLQNYIEQNCSLTKEKAAVEENNYKIITELEEMHKSILDLQKECHSKNKSLACISAELTQTAMSRSELCNESQYVVSCIRLWLEEQKKYTESLTLKLKTKQELLMQLGLDKKALLATIKELRRVNNLLTQKLKRTCRTSRGVKNVCTKCYIIPSVIPQNTSARTSPNSNYLCSPKKGSIGPIKTARRITAYGNPWWFPKMEYLTTELRKNNVWYDETLHNELIVQNNLDESRDYGYQSSTSK